MVLLLPERDAHLISADAANSDDELASDLMADVPEHLLAQTMPRPFRTVLTMADMHVTVITKTHPPLY